MNKTNVNVNAKNLNTGTNATMNRDEAVETVKEVVVKASELFPVNNTSAEVVLDTEGSDYDPVQKVKIKMDLDGNVIVQSAHSRSIKKAIERAANDLERQVRKLKTKKVDGRQKARRAGKEQMHDAAKADEIGFDELI